jgi:hypothetical protein
MTTNSYSPATIELMVHAVRLASCWCTEPVWYAPKLPPIKCTVCLAREAMLRDNPPPVAETPSG